jgi:hypothetical protein
MIAPSFNAAVPETNQYEKYFGSYCHFLTRATRYRRSWPRFLIDVL